MNTFYVCRWSLCWVCVVAAGAAAHAHHGPAHVIDQLDERLAAGGPNARLLARRGDELRALGRLRDAVSDYQGALELDADYAPALLGLAKCKLDLGDPREAARVCDLGLTHTSNADARGPYLALRAKAQRKLGDDAAALADWAQAIEGRNAQVDWMLQHAKTLGRLGRMDEARDALQRACQRNPSAVLHREWIAALVECGDLETAAPLIESGLARSRFQSGWLLLRSRLRAAQGSLTLAEQDARQAIAELGARMAPGVANPVIRRQIDDAERLLDSYRSGASSNED